MYEEGGDNKWNQTKAIKSGYVSLSHLSLTSMVSMNTYKTAGFGFIMNECTLVDTAVMYPSIITNLEYNSNFMLYPKHQTLIE
jgi:hypothetical protein